MLNMITELVAFHCFHWYKMTTPILSERQNCHASLQVYIKFCLVTEECDDTVYKNTCSSTVLLYLINSRSKKRSLSQ